MMLMMMMFHYSIMELRNNLDKFVRNYLNKYYIDQMIGLDDIMNFHLLLLSMMLMVMFEDYQYRIVRMYLLEYLLLMMYMFRKLVVENLVNDRLDDVLYNRKVEDYKDNYHQGDCNDWVDGDQQLNC